MNTLSRFCAAVTALCAVVAALAASAAAAERTAVEFTSARATLVGYHHRPDPSRKGRPIVVMGHGFGLLQTSGLQPFIARFNDAGYDVFTFDYRSWGESGGTPRQVVDPEGQVADWKRAIATARTLPGVDPERVALWGTSFSGGHVLRVAATEPGLEAVISQVPHVNGLATTAAIPFPVVIALGVRAAEDAARAAVGRPPVYVKLTDQYPRVAAMPQRGSADGYLALIQPGSPWRNAVAARVAVALPFYSPDAVAARSTTPTFIGVGRRDIVTPPTPAVRLARRMGAELHEYDAGHFDAYRGSTFEALVADEVAFLQAKMPAT